jgi:Protein of unknown function (DUF3309)
MFTEVVDSPPSQGQRRSRRGAQRSPVASKVSGNVSNFPTMGVSLIVSERPSLEPKKADGTYGFVAERSAIGTNQTWSMVMSVGTIILIILVIALLGGFSGIGGGPFYGTGYYGGGGLGLVVVILLILLLLGKL